MVARVDDSIMAPSVSQQSKLDFDVVSTEQEKATAANNRESVPASSPIDDPAAIVVDEQDRIIAAAETRQEVKGQDQPLSSCGLLDPLRDTSIFVDADNSVKNIFIDVENNAANQLRSFHIDRQRGQASDEEGREDAEDDAPTILVDCENMLRKYFTGESSTSTATGTEEEPLVVSETETKEGDSVDSRVYHELNEETANPKVEDISTCNTEVEGKDSGNDTAGEEEAEPNEAGTVLGDQEESKDDTDNAEDYNIQDAEADGRLEKVEDDRKDIAAEQVAQTGKTGVKEEDNEEEQEEALAPTGTEMDKEKVDEEEIEEPIKNKVDEEEIEEPIKNKEEPPTEGVEEVSAEPINIEETVIDETKLEDKSTAEKPFAHKEAQLTGEEVEKIRTVEPLDEPKFKEEATAEKSIAIKTEGSSADKGEEGKEEKTEGTTKDSTEESEVVVMNIDDGMEDIDLNSNEGDTSLEKILSSAEATANSRDVEETSSEKDQETVEEVVACIGEQQKEKALASLQLSLLKEQSKRLLSKTAQKVMVATEIAATTGRATAAIASDEAKATGIIAAAKVAKSKTAKAGKVLGEASDKAAQKTKAAGTAGKQAVVIAAGKAKSTPAAKAIGEASGKAAQKTKAAGAAGKKAVVVAAAKAKSTPAVKALGEASGKAAQKTKAAVATAKSTQDLFASQEPTTTTRTTFGTTLNEDDRTICRTRQETITTTTRGTMFQGCCKNIERQVVTEVHDVDRNEPAVERNMVKAREEAKEKAEEMARALAASKESAKCLLLPCRSKKNTIEAVVNEKEGDAIEVSIIEEETDDSSDEESICAAGQVEKEGEFPVVCIRSSSRVSANSHDLGRIHSTMDVKLCATCTCDKCRYSLDKKPTLDFVKIGAHVDVGEDDVGNDDTDDDIGGCSCCINEAVTTAWNHPRTVYW